MIELEQCPFCNGKTEIVTLSCSSGGTPCYCFRCTKCGGIRRFGTLNPADICRECEQRQKGQQLEQAGNRLSNRIQDVLNNIIISATDESALLDALEKWDKAKED